MSNKGLIVYNKILVDLLKSSNNQIVKDAILQNKQFKNSDTYLVAAQWDLYIDILMHAKKDDEDVIQKISDITIYETIKLKDFNLSPAELIVTASTLCIYACFLNKVEEENIQLIDEISEEKLALDTQEQKQTFFDLITDTLTGHIPLDLSSGTEKLLTESDVRALHLANNIVDIKNVQKAIHDEQSSTPKGLEDLISSSSIGKIAQKISKQFESDLNLENPEDLLHDKDKLAELFTKTSSAVVDILKSDEFSLDMLTKDAQKTMGQLSGMGIDMNSMMAGMMGGSGGGMDELMKAAMSGGGIPGMPGMPKQSHKKKNKKKH